MPKKETKKKAAKAKDEGKSPSTQAGEFVREEMHDMREDKDGPKSKKQAIAIGLSKARRAGVKAKPGKSASAKTKKKARQDIKAGQKKSGKKSTTRTKTAKKAGGRTASKTASSRRSKPAARKRPSKARSTRTKASSSRRRTAKK